MKVKYPKGETVWVSYFDSAGKIIYFMTSKDVRDFYFLYEVSSDGNVKKLGRAKIPSELEEKYSVFERMLS